MVCCHPLTGTEPKTLDLDAILPSLSVGLAASMIYWCCTVPMAASQSEAVLLTAIVALFACRRIFQYAAVLRLREMRRRDREFWADHR